MNDLTRPPAMQDSDSSASSRRRRHPRAGTAGNRTRRDVSTDDHARLAEAIQVSYRDLERRAQEFLRTRRHPATHGRPVPMQDLHDLGAWLAMEDLVRTGAMSVIAPAFPRSAGYCRLKAVVLSVLMPRASGARPRSSEVAPSWGITCLRLLHGIWWDIAAYRDGGPLARTVARVELTEEALGILAELLWAKRSEAAN